MSLFSSYYIPLTVLSFGAGQDSTALLYMYIHDKAFREKYAPGKLLVVMSDTGDEHDETYEHIAFVENLCQMHKIEFHFLKPGMGYHGRTWPSLRAWMEHHKGIFSKAFPKSCTDQLKIQPIYKFLDHWLHLNYGTTWGEKRGIKEYVKQFGKIDVLLGIAAGEDKRLNPDTGPKWMRESIRKVYALHEMGMDRQACQDKISDLGYEIPMPSNCKLCPFMSEQELVYLYRFYPLDYEYWVLREKEKMQKHRDQKNPKANCGVWGKPDLTLPEVLEIALEKYGHWTFAQLREYKMSHGHCVKSKF